MCQDVLVFRVIEINLQAKEGLLRAVRVCPRSLRRITHLVNGYSSSHSRKDTADAVSPERISIKCTSQIANPEIVNDLIHAESTGKSARMSARDGSGSVMSISDSNLP